MILPAILLSAFSFFAIGFVLAGLMPTPRTAQAVGMALFYPMLFLSGAAIPRFMMPETLQQIAAYLPLTQVVILLEDLWFTGTWNLTAVAVMTAVLILGLVISRFTFRWE
jgi:ABC-2 type transport system permease protein